MKKKFFQNDYAQYKNLKPIREMYTKFKGEILQTTSLVSKQSTELRKKKHRKDDNNVERETRMPNLHNRRLNRKKEGQIT